MGSAHIDNLVRHGRVAPVDVPAVPDLDHPLRARLASLHVIPVSEQMPVSRQCESFVGVPQIGADFFYALAHGDETGRVEMTKRMDAAVSNTGLLQQGLPHSFSDVMCVERPAGLGREN